jgi:hypothetical protein
MRSGKVDTQRGMAAANYELDALVKHISKNHPKEGAAVSIVAAALLIWFGPKVWRAITA